MHNCEVLNAFGTYDLDAQVYGVLSVASQLAADVKNKANRVRLAVWLFNFDRKLAAFLDEVHALVEGKKTVPSGGEPVTPETLKVTAENLAHGARIIDYIYEQSRRAGLTNSTLTAASLRSLRKHNEELIDLVDWLVQLAEPKPVNEAFARAALEKESGEVYDLSQVD
jgi:hypothetical protein